MSGSSRSPAISDRPPRAPGRAGLFPFGRGVCLAIGLTVGVLLGRFVGRSSRRVMPHLATFRRALGARHGEVAAAVLAARIQARYDDLYAAHPRFAHPVLRAHLIYQILPGLALYQILRENEEKQHAAPGTALKEAGEVIDRMDMLARWLPLLRYQPFAFQIFRRIGKWSLALFPKEGWEYQMIEDSSQRLAFNFSRCFYLDVLTAYGASELTALYCHIDDVAYAALPSRITWERTTTLARGGPYCDFCWRVDRPESSHPAEKKADAAATR